MSPREGSRKPRVTDQRDGPTPGIMRSCLQCGRETPARSRPGALCAACDAVIAEEVQARVRTIKESLRKLKNEPAVAGKLQEWDLILVQTEALQQYEARGILTTCPPPSTLLQDFQTQREALARTGGA